MPDNLRRIYPQSFEGASPPEFGIDANTVKVRTINLAVAHGTPHRIDMGGNFIWVVNASSLAATCQLFLGDASLSGSGFPIGQGFFMRGIRFSRVFITNLAQAGESLTLLYGVDMSDTVSIENPSIAYSSVTTSKATVFDTVADVAVVAAAAAAQILAANAARRAAIICSLAANAQIVRIGDTNTGAARGAELSPGESITIETTEAIYAYTGAGANQDLAIAWTED